MEKAYLTRLVVLILGVLTADPSNDEPVMKIPLGDWFLPTGAYDRDSEGKTNAHVGPGVGADAVEGIRP